MTAFNRVLEKHNWAKKHIEKFDSAFRDFRLATPHTIGREDNVETGQVRYYVKQVPAIPDELSFMLGDTLHSLRSTLDHLAYALVTAAGGKLNRQTSFPISDSANKYPSLVVKKVPGLRQPCYDILHSIQPWKGGLGHQLWQLHELDIVDKHRVLLTVSSVPVGRSMTTSEKSAFRSRKLLLAPTLSTCGNVHSQLRIHSPFRCEQGMNSVFFR
jgi:hypothetical protein